MHLPNPIFCLNPFTGYVELGLRASRFTICFVLFSAVGPADQNKNGLLKLNSKVYLASYTCFIIKHLYILNYTTYHFPPLYLYFIFN